MPTKGPSNKYGSHAIKPTQHTGYAWAKDFNKNTLDRHFEDHGKAYSTKKEYVAHAVSFANTIDRKNNISFKTKKGSTYRYNKNTNEFAIIDKKGYVISYFKPKDDIKYFLDQRRKYIK